MGCNTSGSLESIAPPVTPEDCGCNCEASDLTYTGAPFECAGVLPNEKFDSLLTKILTKLCNMSADIDVSTITWECVSNPPEDTDVVSILQFIADNGIFKSGNDCDCPITGDLTFSVGHGLQDCSTGQQSVLFLADGIVETTANKQKRISSDLKVGAGFGAGIDSVVVSNVDLSVTAPEDLKLSYVIEAGVDADITITLPDLKDTLGYNANRVIGFKREDCETSATVTIVGFDDQTIDGSASFVVPAGHSVILHGDAIPNVGAWHIMADYGDYCEGDLAENLSVAEKSLTLSGGDYYILDADTPDGERIDTKRGLVKIIGDGGVLTGVWNITGESITSDKSIGTTLDIVFEGSLTTDPYGGGGYLQIFGIVIPDNLTKNGGFYVRGWWNSIDNVWTSEIITTYGERVNIPLFDNANGLYTKESAIDLSTVNVIFTPSFLSTEHGMVNCEGSVTLDTQASPNDLVLLGAARSVKGIPNYENVFSCVVLRSSNGDYENCAVIVTPGNNYSTNIYATSSSGFGVGDTIYFSPVRYLASYNL